VADRERPVLNARPLITASKIRSPFVFHPGWPPHAPGQFDAGWFRSPKSFSTTNTTSLMALRLPRAGRAQRVSGAPRTHRETETSGGRPGLTDIGWLLRVLLEQVYESRLSSIRGQAAPN